MKFKADGMTLTQILSLLLESKLLEQKFGCLVSVKVTKRIVIKRRTDEKEEVAEQKPFLLSWHKSKW